jgi:predicted nuclease with TOPRIM domain
MTKPTIATLNGPAKTRIRCLAELAHQRGLLLRDNGTRIESRRRRVQELDDQLTRARRASQRNETLEAKLEAEAERLRQLVAADRARNDELDAELQPSLRLLRRIFDRLEDGSFTSGTHNMIERIG